jgi:hypothetical protein
MILLIGTCCFMFLICNINGKRTTAGLETELARHASVTLRNVKGIKKHLSIYTKDMAGHGEASDDDAQPGYTLQRQQAGVQEAPRVAVPRHAQQGYEVRCEEDEVAEADAQNNALGDARGLQHAPGGMHKADGHSGHVIMSQLLLDVYITL